MLSDVSRGNWVAVYSQHHAEDEFRAGVFGSALFDRVAVVQASFEWEIQVEMPSSADADACVYRLKQALESNSGHSLTLGGSVWAGYGRLKWAVNELAGAPAGQAWGTEGTEDQEGVPI